MSASGSRRVASLVEQHYESLFRYAYRLSGTQADAEDLTQEAFCKAQAQLGQLRDPDRARPWLFSILRNAYLQRARTDRAHRQVPFESVGELAAEPPAEVPEIGTEQLQRVLNELPEGFRTPVILFYFEEMSYRDIADQMARAKSHMRQRLGNGSADGEVKSGL
jgi:RNA polymerase sigma-70 factor (ECF subfamily)